MKVLVLFVLLASCLGAEVPDIFKGLFEEEIPVKASIGIVEPPKEIDKYLAKVKMAASEKPEWFREYSATTPPGIPLPYHENLGLTKEEYDEYIALWNKRTFKPREDVILVLRKTLGNTWTLTATGGAGVISTLRYDTSNDTFISPSGALTRLDDINTDENHILGSFTVKEWRFQETGLLGLNKINFALGKYTKTDFGIILFRAQEVSPEGQSLHDNSIIMRFALGKAGQLTPKVPATQPK